MEKPKPAQLLDRLYLIAEQLPKCSPKPEAFPDSRANGARSGSPPSARGCPAGPLPKPSSTSQKFDRRLLTCGLAHAVSRPPTTKPFPSASPGPGRIAYLPSHRGDLIGTRSESKENTYDRYENRDRQPRRR